MSDARTPDRPSMAQRAGEAAGRKTQEFVGGFDRHANPGGWPTSPVNGSGYDAFGDPFAPTGPAGQAGVGPYRQQGHDRSRNIGQIAQAIGSAELSNQDDLYMFCEYIRAISNYCATSIGMAAGQLKASARSQAKQSKDGRLNPAQAAKLKAALVFMGRDLDSSAKGFVEAATGAVKAWRRIEAVMQEIEASNDNGRKFRRPGGGSGGFNLV